MNQLLSCVFVSRRRRNLSNSNKCQFSDKIKLKYCLTRAFNKLSYFLQSLGGSSYRELGRSVAIILNICSNFFLKKKNIWAAEEFTWCNSKIKQGVLPKKKMNKINHPFTLLLLRRVYPFFLFHYCSIAIR